MDDLISRQQAIDVLGKIFPADPMRNDYTQGITCGAALATEYIKQLPSAQEKRTQERTETHACDLISRQAAIEAVEFGITYAKAINKSTGEVKELFKEGNRALNEAVGRIKDLPSAQPEIVRCKDCNFWMPHSQFGYDEDNGTYHDYCAKLVPEDEYYAFYRNADDYCSRAERRTDDTD